MRGGGLRAAVLLYRGEKMDLSEALYQSALAASKRPLDGAAFARTGSRLAFEEVYFARRKCLSAAAVLALTRGGEWLAAAREGMETILSEPTWVHPAHGEELDLFAAETGFLLAETASLLPLGREERARVFGEVNRRVIGPFCSRTYWWEEGKNNWTAVCLGNVAGAMRYADGGALAAQRERIKTGLLRYLEGFPADGWCAEGLEYWNFGFGAFVRFSEMLFPELLDHPAVREIAKYPHRCFLAGNVTASFGDCPAEGRADVGLVNFLSARYGLPLLPAGQTEVRTANCAWLPFSRTLRDGVRVSEGSVREEGLFCGGQIFVGHRAAYSYAVKAGHNGEEHNHNDVGSFLLATEAGQILADLGQPLYDRDYFSPRRYENLAASSLGHSVPVVNGGGQCAGREHGGTLSADGRRAEFAGAYENCKKMVRTFDFGETSAAVADEFSAEDAVTERFVLLKEPSRCGARIFSREGLVPRVKKEFFFAHNGQKTPVFLMDFEVPKGRTFASFCMELEK